MIKEQQHSLNKSNSNAQCQSSQTLSPREEELLCLQAPRAWAISSTPLLLIRGTPGWRLGGKPVPASSRALCGITSKFTVNPPQSTGHNLRTTGLVQLYNKLAIRLLNRIAKD